jgi:hypothetical protein
VSRFATAHNAPAVTNARAINPFHGYDPNNPMAGIEREARPYVDVNRFGGDAVEAAAWAAYDPNNPEGK